jgi:tRNA uridine 5-carbamoylmethylation protein Kti12
MAAVDRSLTRKLTVILDTHNNIKGYRYQLWCIARLVGAGPFSCRPRMYLLLVGRRHACRTGQCWCTCHGCKPSLGRGQLGINGAAAGWLVYLQAGTRYCLVHVDTPPETCRQWNQEREAASSYSETIFEDLACRFERPDSKNRWDSPLFTLRPLLGSSQMQEQLEAVAAAVADAPRPAAQVAAAAAAAAAAQQQDAAAAGGPFIAGAADQPPVRLAKELRPHVATDTASSKLSATNLLHDVDRALQQVLERVAEAQAAAGSGAPGLVTFPSSSSSGGDEACPLPPLDLYRPVSMFASLTPC